MSDAARCPLTVIVLTLNEETNLPGCLRSLEGLHSELFLVDSGSTDRTLDIARMGGATVVSHPFETYATQRNWAQTHVPLRTSWVLHLDADERLTPELVSEINAVLDEAPADVSGFLLRKRTIFMGRWIKHGGHYPSYHARLFRPGRGTCEDRLYDQHFLVEGQLRQLKHDYVDVLTGDLGVWSGRHALWAKLEAREIVTKQVGKRQIRPVALGNAIERKRWLRERAYGRAPLFLRALAYWAYRYVVRLGFLDGTEGLIFHFLQGFWFRFLVDAMIYERRRAAQRAANERGLPDSNGGTGWYRRAPTAVPAREKWADRGQTP